MPARHRRYVAVAAIAVGLAVAGCTPAGFDAQQQRAESRECASYLERHVIRGGSATSRIIVDGKTIDLGSDPEGFYSQLEAVRGPDAFSFSGGNAERAQRASFISDLCKAKDAPAITASTTTTSTTTTTVPATTAASRSGG